MTLRDTFMFATSQTDLKGHSKTAACNVEYCDVTFRIVIQFCMQLTTESSGSCQSCSGSA